MSEILVEEENTIYELDEECLKKKQKQEEIEDEIQTAFHVQGYQKANWSVILVLCCLCLK